MINIKETVTGNESMLNEAQFPLINRWVENAIAVEPLRRDVLKALDGDENAKLTEMGFPGDIIPIMKLWRTQGPEILTSFAHPEELDLYKIIGVLNLKLFQQQAQKKGINFSRILVNHYDTVPFHKSAIKPFQVGNFASKLGLDPFNLQNKGGYILQSRQSVMSLSEAENTKTQFTASIPKAISFFMELLKEHMLKDVKARGTEVDINKQMLTQSVQQLLLRRMEIMLENFRKAKEGKGDPLSISKFLMDFQTGLACNIFNLPEGSNSIEESLGFSAVLASENSQFLDLLRQSLLMLVRSRGTGIIKNIVMPREGLGLIKLPDGSNGLLSKNDDDDLVIVDKCDQVTILSDQEVENAITRTLPLGKLENLAINAGGIAFHMGSEYGIREKIIHVLGVQGEATEYLRALRVGEDKEQGSDGILLKGTKSYMPLPMCFLLLGDKGVRELIAHFVGVRNEPIELDVAEIQLLCAKRLVDDILNSKN